MPKMKIITIRIPTLTPLKFNLFDLNLIETRID
jgi:hypothetical protein